LTTLLRFRNEILEPETAETDTNPEALNAFRQIWQGALEIERKGEANQTTSTKRKNGEHWRLLEVSYRKHLTSLD
jgi:hypothetical protein